MVTKDIKLKTKHNPEVNIKMTNSSHQTISLVLITAVATTTIKLSVQRKASNHMVTMITTMIIRINNTAEGTRATSTTKTMEAAISRNKQVEIQCSDKESNLEATLVQLLTSHQLECTPHQVENQLFNCFEN